MLPQSIALAVVMAEGRWLMRRRADASPELDDHLEVPGGKLGVFEKPAAAALRELREECGQGAEGQRWLGSWTHRYRDRYLRFYAYAFEVDPRHWQARSDSAMPWSWHDAALLALRPDCLPAANQPLFRYLGLPR